MLNVQADVRQRLEDALHGVAVRVSVPADRPSELVTVRRVGGMELNALVDRPRLEVLCWAPTEARACELAGEVACAMRSLPFAAGYARVTQESMYSDRDMLAGSPRWYLSYSLHTYDTKGRND